MRIRRLISTILLTVFVLLSFNVEAQAQSVTPTEDQYSNLVLQGQNDFTPPQLSSQVELREGQSKATLPFTGFDVIAMIAVALFVFALGLLLRYMLRKDLGQNKPLSS